MTLFISRFKTGGSNGTDVKMSAITIVRVIGGKYPTFIKEAAEGNKTGEDYSWGREDNPRNNYAMGNVTFT